MKRTIPLIFGLLLIAPLVSAQSLKLTDYDITGQDIVNMMAALAAFSLPIWFLTGLFKPGLRPFFYTHYALVVKVTAFAMGALLAFAVPQIAYRIAYINTLPTDLQPIAIGVALAIGAGGWHRLSDLFRPYTKEKYK